METKPRSNFFDATEFDCRCGRCGLGFNDMSNRLLERLYDARKHAGTPFVITSAIRCAEHNRKVGGTSNSAHLKGMAIDIAFTSSQQRFKILRGLFLAGFTRIGYNQMSKFIHADVDTTLPQEVFFNY